MRSIVYWLTTVLVSFGLGMSGYMNYSHNPEMVANMQGLGFNEHFMSVLGFWKMLVPVALLFPGFGRLKEWCYAGVFFTLTGAACLHGFAGDGHMTAPLVILALALVSYALRPASRCVGGAIVPEFG